MQGRIQIKNIIYKYGKRVSFMGTLFSIFNRKIKCKDRNGGIYELKKRGYY